MNSRTLTIRLPDDVRKKLDAASKHRGVASSAIVREALERFLAVQTFRRLRSRGVSAAEKKGVVTDEDVFDLVS